jgi:hypothetical protein
MFPADMMTASQCSAFMSSESSDMCCWRAYWHSPAHCGFLACFHDDAAQKLERSNALYSEAGKEHFSVAEQPNYSCFSCCCRGCCCLYHTCTIVFIWSGICVSTALLLSRC